MDLSGCRTRYLEHNSGSLEECRNSSSMSCIFLDVVSSGYPVTFPYPPQMHPFSWTFPFFNLIALSFALCTALVVYLLASRDSTSVLSRVIPWKKWKLPPGPRGAPVVGNLLQMRRIRRDPKELAAYVSSTLVTIHEHTYRLS